jgi:hypothetical protein
VWPIGRPGHEQHHRNDLPAALPALHFWPVERAVGLMPRRNRNAHACRIDADALADQADQLTAELAAANTGIVIVIDESPLYAWHGAITGLGKSNVIRDYITQFVYEHPGCQISLTDAKVVTTNGRI